MNRKNGTVVLLCLWAAWWNFAYAEVFHCGQTWQNRPCSDSQGVAVFEEREPALLTAEENHFKTVQATKKYLWGLQNRYPSSILIPLKAAVTACEAQTISIDECEQTLAKKELTLRSEVERINGERMKEMADQRARAQSLEIENAKLKEMRRQTELQEQQKSLQELELNELRNMRNEPQQIIVHTH